MPNAFERLQQVLELEAKQGFRDKAVVGGMRQFAAHWVSQAREETGSEAEAALVEQVAEVLVGYGRLPGREARAAAFTRLQERISRRPGGSGGAGGPAPRPAPVEADAGRTEAAGRGRPAPAAAETASAEPGGREEAGGQASGPAPTAGDAGPEEAAAAGSAPAEPDPEGLAQPVTTLKGAGKVIAAHLANLGAETIEQALYILPRRYDDYTLMKPINRLSYGETVTVIGTIWSVRSARGRGHTRVEAIISDGSGRVTATWFNQPWLTKSLRAGMQVVLSGAVDQYLGRPQFQNPEWEPVELEPLRTRRIVPVYPLTKGIGPQRMRQVMRQAVEQWAPKVAEPLPQALRRRLGLYPLPQALAQAHFPDSQESLGRARRRLVFDELFLLQLGMLGTRRQRQAEPGTPIPTNREALDAFAAGLPFALTAAQGRVIAEIAADVARPQPMTRLLQGDVGSGKTAVAAAAMLLAVRAGRQAALMAPTEILAEQHARSLGELLAAAGVRVGLLTGSTPPAEREQRYAELADGRAQVVVGTHALIQAGVRFHDLGLAVVDEQHRFGVEQRGALRAKGGNGGPAPAGAPHLLVMSATPIPRTLALSLYGDLDLSTLDEMPPDRQEIKTYWLKPGQRERAYRFVRKQVQAGRQAFIICPLVEESDKSEAKAATAEFERLQQHIFPDLKLGLVHGRMRPADKEAAMRAFYAGEHDVLVATSVIEVGVDVPNSTVMLIEGANRFGLAQLHQFRGRVGRGEHQSFCLLLADDGYEGGGERLAALEQSNDGFALAERDLELRGPGEFFGQRQSGLPELRLASLLDLPLLEMARAEAGQLLESDPELARPEHRLLRQKLDAFWSQAAEVS